MSTKSDIIISKSGEYKGTKCVTLKVMAARRVNARRLRERVTGRLLPKLYTHGAAQAASLVLQGMSVLSDRERGW